MEEFKGKWAPLTAVALSAVVLLSGAGGFFYEYYFGEGLKPGEISLPWILCITGAPGTFASIFWLAASGSKAQKE